MAKKYLVTAIFGAVSVLAYFISVVENSSPSDFLGRFVRSQNYTLETHEMLTEDGYYLIVHRIPGPPRSTPVYIQHGILSSSADWLLAGKNKALPFILADNGYDVWIGNVRGNYFSSRHKTLSQSDPEFWNFSWSEEGFYDIAAAVTYIASETNSKMFYVGHSMGCTRFSVMASERPDIAKNVKAMISLAPATYEFHIKHPLVRSASKRWSDIQSKANSLGVYSFLPRTRFYDFLASLYYIPGLGGSMYRALFYLVDGVVPKPHEEESFPNYLTTFPAGTSMKLLIHWLQQMNVNEFQKFDYGRETNLKVYGTVDPPKYDLSKVQVPVAVFYSDNDLVTTSKDSENFYNQLPLKLGIYKVDSLTHSDFLWREEATKLIYYEIVKIFKKIS